MAHNQVMFTSEGFEKRMILNDFFSKFDIEWYDKTKRIFCFQMINLLFKRHLCFHSSASNHSLMQNPIFIFIAYLLSNHGEFLKQETEMFFRTDIFNIETRTTRLVQYTITDHHCWAGIPSLQSFCLLSNQNISFFSPKDFRLQNVFISAFYSNFPPSSQLFLTKPNSLFEKVSLN